MVLSWSGGSESACSLIRQHGSHLGHQPGGDGFGGAFVGAGAAEFGAGVGELGLEGGAFFRGIEERG